MDASSRSELPMCEKNAIDEQSLRIERLETAVRSLLSHANFTTESVISLSRGEQLFEIEYVNPDASQALGVAPASSMRLHLATQNQRPSTP